MTEHRIIISEDAYSDLAAIFINITEFYSKRSALSLRADLLSAIRKIAEMPTIARIGRVKNTREFVMKKYIIVFRQDENGIIVLAIKHSRQQYP